MCHVEVNITKGFDSDERKLSFHDRDVLTHSLNGFVDSAKDGLFPKKLYRRRDFVYPDGIKRADSSLYMLKVSSGLYVILAYDSDVIFDQKIITLFRVVKKTSATQAFNTTASLIYAKNAS